jgi:hypothetical protein
MLGSMPLIVSVRSQPRCVASHSIKACSIDNNIPTGQHVPPPAAFSRRPTNQPTNLPTNQVHKHRTDNPHTREVIIIINHPISPQAEK